MHLGCFLKEYLSGSCLCRNSESTVELGDTKIAGCATLVQELYPEPSCQLRKSRQTAAMDGILASQSMDEEPLPHFNVIHGLLSDGILSGCFN